MDSKIGIEMVATGGVVGAVDNLGTKNGYGLHDVIRNPEKYATLLREVNIETIVAILQPHGYLTTDII